MAKYSGHDLFLRQRRNEIGEEIPEEGIVFRAAVKNVVEAALPFSLHPLNLLDGKDDLAIGPELVH